MLNAALALGHSCFSAQISTIQALCQPVELAAAGPEWPVLAARRDNRGDSLGRAAGTVAAAGLIDRRHRDIIEFDANLMRI